MQSTKKREIMINANPAKSISFLSPAPGVYRRHDIDTSHLYIGVVSSFFTKKINKFKAIICSFQVGSSEI